MRRRSTKIVTLVTPALLSFLDVQRPMAKEHRFQQDGVFECNLTVEGKVLISGKCHVERVYDSLFKGQGLSLHAETLEAYEFNQAHPSQDELPLSEQKCHGPWLNISSTSDDGSRAERQYEAYWGNGCHGEPPVNAREMEPNHFSGDTFDFSYVDKCRGGEFVEYLGIVELSGPITARSLAELGGVSKCSLAIPVVSPCFEKFFSRLRNFVAFNGFQRQHTQILLDRSKQSNLLRLIKRTSKDVLYLQYKVSIVTGRVYFSEIERTSYGDDEPLRVPSVSTSQPIGAPGGRLAIPGPGVPKAGVHLSYEEKLEEVKQGAAAACDLASAADDVFARKTMEVLGIE